MQAHTRLEQALALCPQALALCLHPVGFNIESIAGGLAAIKRRPPAQVRWQRLTGLLAILLPVVTRLLARRKLPFIEPRPASHVRGQGLARPLSIRQPIAARFRPLRTLSIHACSPVSPRRSRPALHPRVGAHISTARPHGGCAVTLHRPLGAVLLHRWSWSGVP
ncbi:MAG: hypothetical protein ABSH20_27260, partial [Tepidisphaeraceae bacterium]